MRPLLEVVDFTGAVDVCMQIGVLKFDEFAAVVADEVLVIRLFENGLVVDMNVRIANLANQSGGRQ